MLGLTIQTAGQGLHRPQVVVIHGENPIEAVQISRFNLTGPAGQMDAAALGRRPHAPVRRVAHMPAARAGAVHHKLILQALPGQQVQEHPLSGRRAADIAEANE